MRKKKIISGNSISKNRRDEKKKIKRTSSAAEGRLKVGNGIMKERWKMSSQEKRKLLGVRARELAEEPKDEKITEAYLEFVEFVVAYEHYGIESSYIREVYPLKDFIPLPCTPEFILGIANIRGQIISVIDIKKFFSLPEKGLTDLNRVIVLNTPDMELGILADVILGVRMVYLNEIQPTLPTLTDIRLKYLRGVTKEQIVILDAEKLLSDPKLVVHEKVET